MNFLMSGKNVEVEESGRALKVHTRTPHLVSLGGGRWSTAVTLHQIPEGRQSLGSTPASDIVVKGKGVEPVHCYVENEMGAVTLYPIENCNVSVDGTTICLPTKLTQGSTVCIGKNSCFRYNNPAEASVIKKSLSDSFRRKCKRSKNKSPSHDSWDSNLAAEEILANLISPKVFPSNSVTVNSPASVVLGPNKFPTNLNGNLYVKPNDLQLNSYQSLTKSPSPQYRTVPSPSPSFDRNPTYPSPKINNSAAPQSPLSTKSPQLPKSPSLGRSYSFEKENGDLNGDADLEAEQVRLEEILNLCTDYERQIQWERAHKSQPNRIITNGSLPRDKRLNSPTVVPSPIHDQSFSFDNITSDTTMNGSMAPLNNSVNVYDTPTIPHPGSPRTRIKTTVGNNELPAPLSSIKQTENSLDILEKKLALLNDFEISNLDKNKGHLHNNNQWTQDKSTSTSASSQNYNGNKYKFLGLENSSAIGGDTKSNVNHRNGDLINNSNIMSRSYPSNQSSDSPNFTNHRSNFKLTNNCIFEDPNETCEDDSVDLMSKSYHCGVEPADHGKENSMSFNNLMTRSFTSTNTSSYNNNYTGIKRDNPDKKVQNNQIKSNSQPKAYFYTNSIDRRTVKQNGGFNLDNKQEMLEKEKQKIEGLVNELEALVKSPAKSLSRKNSLSGPHDAVDNVNVYDCVMKSTNTNIPKANNLRSNSITNITANSTNNDLNFILPLEHIDNVLKKQRASLNGDIEELKESRRQLINELSEIKSKVQDIQQHEEELSRELELERALLDGEWKSENELLSKEEKRVALLQEKIDECEQEMENCKVQQKERQQLVKNSLEQQQSVLKTLQHQLENCNDELRDDLNESISQQQELLELEKKSFEDQEFSLLEEEADWLTKREELQREISEAKHKYEERKAKLKELSAQREKVSRTALEDTTDMNTQLMSYLRTIEETKNKLKEIDLQLKDISKIKGLEYTPNSTDTEEETNDHKQSQDDIDRITRVTTDAPIMEMNSNSLGRRTIASLQEIEKHRQLHLAKQGSLVIEEERKRVLELKKRVQEEVKMQWENDHKKSVDEDSTSLPPCMQSETPSEEFDKITDHIMSSSSVSPDSMYSKSITSSSFRDQKEDRDPESRPMSDSSAYSEDQLSVRLRNNKSNVQRPLTRYLPFRGESMDLRQHIEAAGHQLELCSHLTIDSTSCRGYLNKMAGRFHHWNKRWFVFDRNKRCLTYYADRSEKKQRGFAYFRNIEEVYVDHLNSVKSPNPHLTFIVKSNDRTFYLMAPSAEAMRIWIDVIFSGAEGYQEFGR